MSTQRERRLRARALNSATALRQVADDPDNFTCHRPPFTVSWKDGEGPHVEKMEPKLDPAIEAVLTDVWGGAHNVKVREAYLEPRPHARVLTHRGLSTFDDDSLTRLVVACHRHAVRAELGEGGFGATAIWLHKREHGADRQMDRHADLEDLELFVHDNACHAGLYDDDDDDDDNDNEVHDARPIPVGEQPLPIDAADLRAELGAKVEELLALARRCARSRWRGSADAKASLSLAVSAVQDAIAATPEEVARG